MTDPRRVASICDWPRTWWNAHWLSCEIPIEQLNWPPRPLNYGLTSQVHGARLAFVIIELELETGK